MKENDLRGLKGKKVYISGKITGLDQAEAIAKFGEAEKVLEELGAIPFNPMCLPEGFSWHNYMRICLAAVVECDVAYMLNNWKDSQGAKLEHREAAHGGKVIFYQEKKTEKEQEATRK